MPGADRKNQTKTKKLSSSETKALFSELRESGDTQIRDTLIENFLYIAEILAKKFVNRGIDYDDLYQVACIGLIYAIDRYDVSKGFEFSSFATPTIIGEIKKYFRDKGWTVKVPRRMQDLSKKVNESKNNLTNILNRSPNVADIAKDLGISEEEVLEAMEASKFYSPQSLNLVYETSQDDNKVSLGDLIGIKDENFDKIENTDFLMDIMKDLNEMERTIILERFLNKKTQEEIGNKLGVSQMTVSRIEKKTLTKIRKTLKD